MHACYHYIFILTMVPLKIYPYIVSFLHKLQLLFSIFRRASLTVLSILSSLLFLLKNNSCPLYQSNSTHLPTRYVICHALCDVNIKTWNIDHDVHFCITGSESTQSQCITVELLFIMLMLSVWCILKIKWWSLQKNLKKTCEYRGKLCVMFVLR